MTDDQLTAALLSTNTVLCRMLRDNTRAHLATMQQFFSAGELCHRWKLERKQVLALLVERDISDEARVPLRDVLAIDEKLAEVGI